MGPCSILVVGTKRRVSMLSSYVSDVNKSLEDYVDDDTIVLASLAMSMIYDIVIISVVSAI